MKWLRYWCCLVYLVFFLNLFGCFGLDRPVPENTCSTPVGIYNRDAHFGDWIDEDGDGENTRFEVLIEENQGSDEFYYRDNTKYFVGGKWTCPYSGKTFTDPSQLDIDHVVPLKEAWDSGACFWNNSERIRFYNFLSDVNHLIAVDASLNRQKSDQDPFHWRPPNSEFEREYLLIWTRIKANWGLSADLDEYTYLQSKLGEDFPSSIKITTCSCY